MLASILLLVSAGVLLLFIYLRRLTKPSQGDPPCPGSDPLIGSFRYLKSPLYRYIASEFSREDIVLLFLGPTRVYILNSFTAFKEALIDNAEALSGRISQKAMAKMTGDYGGIVGSDGELWKQYRRFTLQTLRDFGLGRRGAEHCILQEAEELCTELAQQTGQPIDISLPLGRGISNVICQLVFGSRLASESEEFARILDAFYQFTGNPSFQTETFRAIAFLPISTRFDIVLEMLLKLPGMRSTFKTIAYLMDFCQKQIDRHAADVGKISEARDYIDAHLQYQSLGQASLFNDKRLCLAILDLFLAGTETTMNTLRWGLLYMVANPQVARKVRAEILQHLGPQGRVKMADKSRLHYTVATLEEINRLASLVVNGLVHRVTSQITVCGYRIPADSYVMYNLYHIHRDPVQFPDPEMLKPERHLDSTGHFQACQQVVPFGAGKRACLGESLARMELFIFFVSLMQRFEIRIEEGGSSRAQEMLETVEPFLSTLMRCLPEFKIVLSESEISLP